MSKLGTVITKVSDIPKVEHFAVFSNDHLNVPGDERSRTHPGHGYPAYEHYFLQYTAFNSSEEVQQYLAEHKSLQVTRVVRVVPCEVTCEVKVNVS